jgi:hypothetical protein
MEQEWKRREEDSKLEKRYRRNAIFRGEYKDRI